MKWIKVSYWALAFLGITSSNLTVAIQAHADCVAAPSGIIAWWPGNGNGDDIIGTNNGTTEGVSFSTGKVNQAFSFNNTNQDVKIPASASLNVGTASGFTLEAWIKPANVSVRNPLFEWNAGDGTTYWGVHFYIDPDSYGAGPGALYANIVDSNGYWHQIYSAGGVTQSNVFQHVALTYDKASGTATIYCNGVVVAQQTIGSFTPLTIYNLYLGRRLLTQGEAYTFNGLLDEPAIYNRALSSNEITAIYQADSAGKCSPTITSTCVSVPTNVISWWPAEGNAYDIVGTNNGTLSSTGASYATGKIGQGFRFDGTNGYVWIPDAASLKPTNVTAEAWVWLDPSLPSGRGGEQIMFKKNTWSAWFEGYSLLKVTVDNGNGTYSDRFQFCISSHGNQVILNSQTIAQRGVWYHVAGTYNGSRSTLYVNGVAEASATPGFALDYDTTPLFIGTSGTWAPYLSMFGGIIDEPSIYNRALSSNEIASIYLAGSAGKCPLSTATSPVVPAITAFAPIMGAIGTNVTITGANFSISASNNIVYFGAVRATVIAAATNSLVVKVPAGAIYAPITVTVNGLTASADFPFMPEFLGGSALSSTSLTGPGILSSGNGPAKVSVGDLDGDGKPDVVVANVYDGSVSIYRNIGTNGSVTSASFAAPITFTIGGGNDSVWGLALADVDGDGRLDIVTANRNYNIVSIFRNLSSPGNLTTNSFASRVDFPVFGTPCCVAVADLDGDGKLDIVTANSSSNTVSILRNISSSGVITSNSFASPINYSVPTSPNFISVADVDNDGMPDLITASTSTSTTLSILRNVSTAGNMAFAPHTDFAGIGAGTVIAGDLDGDGKLDLIAGSPSTGQAVSIYRNTSTKGSITISSLAAPVNFPANGWANTVAIGDLDGDGKPDLAVLTQLPSHLSLFRNISTLGILNTGSFGPRIDYTSGWNPNGIAIADFNGDGRPDIAFGNAYDPSVYLYQNQTPFGGVPLITQQPTNRTVTAGATVSFNVVATGTATLSYQWYFNGATVIIGATNASLTLTNVQVGQAGTYSVTVSNAAGSVTSSNATLTVNYPTAIIKVVSTNVPSGKTITVPVVLVANGNENALGFSLNFNPQQLNFVSVAQGAGSAGAFMSANTSQAASGVIGVGLIYADGVSTFSGGNQTVILLTFSTPVLSGTAQSVASEITFASTPVTAQLSDAGGNPLPSSFVNGSVTLTPVDLEGDVAPRPTGSTNHIVSITDWVQEGRFVAGLDTPAVGGEFQRADVAPRATLGNGTLNVADWVQVGRYAMGLDPVTAVGGPTNTASGKVVINTTLQSKAIARVLQITNVTAIKGVGTTLSVNLQSQGDESAISFSFAFNPNAFTLSDVTLGNGSSGAALFVNTNSIATGNVGITLGLLGSTFAAGLDEIARINLTPNATSTNGTYSAAFTDQPVPRTMSDAYANEIGATYMTGTVTLNGLPELTITPAGTNVIVSWPAWAQGFTLQACDITSFGSWTNVTDGLQTNADTISLTAPAAERQFYRLQHN